MGLMRNGVARIFVLLLAVCMPANANAMSTNRHCRVVAGEKMLAASGGVSALCAEIERAIAAAAPKTRYAVDVRALSASRLAALLTVNGRKLPEQHFAVMDRELDAASIREFAESLAEEVAIAAKR